MVKGRKFVSYNLIVWKADKPNPNYANSDFFCRRKGEVFLELEFS
jgi:hypothetical protein